MAISGHLTLAAHTVRRKEGYVLERLKGRPWIQVLTAVASGLVGIVISPIFERIVDPAFDTPTRALLSGFLLLSLLLVVGMIAVGIFATRSEQHRQAISDQMNAIDWKLGVTVEFVYDPPPGTGEVFRRVTEIVKEARDSICVLAHYVKRPHVHREVRRQIRSEAYKQAEIKYGQTLLEKVEEHEAKQYFYRRILQLEGYKDEREFSEEWMSEWTIEHCQSMLEYMQRYRSIILKVAPTFFPCTFVLVDDQYVILAFYGYDPPTLSRWTDSALIFHDPHGSLVRYLRDFFDKVDAHGVIPKSLKEEPG